MGPPHEGVTAARPLREAQPGASSTGLGREEAQVSGGEGSQFPASPSQGPPGRRGKSVDIPGVAWRTDLGHTDAQSRATYFWRTGKAGPPDEVH